MKLRELDFAMNDLMNNFDFGETTEDETNFLINITNDLIELLTEHNIKLKGVNGND